MLKKLINYCRPYKILIILDLFFAFLNPAISLILLLLIKIPMNAAVEGAYNQSYLVLYFSSGKSFAYITKIHRRLFCGMCWVYGRCKNRRQYERRFMQILPKHVLCILRQRIKTQ